MKKYAQSLIIFSQDIIPESIIEDYYSTNTFREFLDSGGSILWLGDIPLFYTGDFDESKEKFIIKNIWKVGAPLRF